MKKYTPVIGLEVHVELKTKSKMFCSCSADYFGKEPNTHTCPVCLGLPGALPVPNRRAIDWCIKIALALNCEINEFSKFDRKNYFYPDLAKGYQISQYDLPFGHDGYVILGNNVTPESKKDAGLRFNRSGQASMTKEKRIRIRRVHMEEDTGKLSHQTVDGKKVSLIDFNRSSVPLVEIVTEADFDNATEVKEYLEKLQQIVRYLDVSNADMEKGEMRLEPNISLSTNDPTPANTFIAEKDLPNYKVEVKNINSFKFVEKAITFEVARQKVLLDKDERPTQETRGWDEKKQQTFSQRSKEDAQDYRYFPEPDIPPIITTKDQISKLRSEVPELPAKRTARFIKEYTLPAYDAEILTREKALADFFEETVAFCRSEKDDNGVEGSEEIDPKAIANWIINKKIDFKTTSPAELVKQIVSAKQTVQVNEKELAKVINEVISENEKAVTDYKNGKEASLMFLLGQVMKKLGKKVDTKMILTSLKKQLV